MLVQTKEQHGASPATTVQFMWFFSKDDSMTFCQWDDQSEPCPVPSSTTPETTTTHTERFWKVCSGVKQTLLTQSFKYGKMQKYIYQPVFGLLAVRSFRVAFFLFRSSAVLSCRRISLILNKYNIVYKELLNYFKDGGLYYFFIY